jgi:peroxiredoxin
VIAPGTPAPDFTLRNQDGERVSLSDFRGGRLVLAFYPADFSPVCTDQLSIYQEVLPEISEQGAELVGVTVDSTWAHKAFQEQLGIDIQLLSDFHPKGEVSRAYGAYVEERGHPNRSLVLIDEQGIVRWVHESPTPLEIPGANLIFDALAELRSETG